MSKSKKSVLSDLKISKHAITAISIKEELNRLFYLQPKYDEELEMLKYQYDHEEEERLGLHLSSITGAGKNFCFREQIVNILYMERVKAGKKVPQKIYDAFKYQQRRNNNPPVNLARIFEEGKSIGTKWQRLFIRGNIGVKEDMDVSRFVDEYDLSYTPDGIITLNGKKYVVEIKSMNKNTFDKANSHPSGQKQLRMYMYLEGIDRGFVLADCKDNSDFKIFPEFNPESDESVANAIALLEKIQQFKKKAIKSKKLPPCKCGKCLV